MTHKRTNAQIMDEISPLPNFPISRLVHVFLKTDKQDYLGYQKEQNFLALDQQPWEMKSELAHFIFIHFRTMCIKTHKESQQGACRDITLKFLMDSGLDKTEIRICIAQNLKFSAWQKCPRINSCFDPSSRSSLQFLKYFVTTLAMTMLLLFIHQELHLCIFKYNCQFNKSN